MKFSLKCYINYTDSMTTSKCGTSDKRGDNFCSQEVLELVASNTSDHSKTEVGVGSTDPGKRPHKHGCDKCVKFFLKPSHVHRHKRAVHGDTSEPPVSRRGNSENSKKPKNHQCDICKKSFFRPSHVLRHKKVAHPESLRQVSIDIGPQSINKTSVTTKPHYMCGVCNKTFNNSSHTRRHLRSVHNVSPESQRHGNLVCSECFSVYSTKGDYTKHILEHHKDLVLETSTLIFATEEEFLAWKARMEEDTAAFYRKTNNHSSSGMKIEYFSCHRSGQYTPGGLGKRRLKTGGSIKIGYFCPARLRVEKQQMPDGSVKVKVTHHSTHLGHECDYSTKVPKSKTKETDLEQHIEEMKKKQNRQHPKKLDWKKKARSAVLALLANLENFTSEEQHKEVTLTLAMLEQKCKKVVAVTGNAATTSTDGALTSAEIGSAVQSELNNISLTDVQYSNDSVVQSSLSQFVVILDKFPDFATGLQSVISTAV